MRTSATIGLAQWLPEPGKPDVNEATAVTALLELAKRGCDVAVLPELWLCGYRTSTLAIDAARDAQTLDGQVGTQLASVAADTSMIVCAGSVPEALDGSLYNTSVLYDRSGARALVHRKVHLYGKESEVFEAGETFSTAYIDELGIVGICICFDGDFPESARTLREQGARVIFHPCAYEAATQRWWDVLYPAHALANGQWWLSCNQHGGLGQDRFFGGSRVIAPNGEVRVGAPALGAAPNMPELVITTVSLAPELETSDREAAALFEARRPAAYGRRFTSTSTRRGAGADHAAFGCRGC